ncbi:hypothetical protein PISMIDRAFT_15582, partial [Pisolithus microcarpus 441]
LADAISTHLYALKRLDLQDNDADEDDEVYDTLREALTARGGRLLVTEEDEEEEGEEEEEKEEEEKPATQTAEAEEVLEKELGDLMGKVRLE